MTLQASVQVEPDKRKAWKDFSAVTRIRIVVMGVVQIVLLAAALWDLRRRPAEQIKGDKRMWMGLVFINFFGPIAYFLFGRKTEEVQL